MDFDEDPLDLLGDDGDGVNEMCLLFDDEGKKQNSQKTPQGTGCSVVILCIGSAAVFVGVLANRIFA